MNWYLDASILVPLRVVEPSSEAVYNLLLSAGSGFVVSTLAVAEYASAISRRVRMGDADVDQAQIWLNQLDDWVASDTSSLLVEDEDVRRGGLIVRRFETKLKTADAIHVGLCERHGLRLVTRDKQLAVAAEILGVNVEILG